MIIDSLFYILGSFLAIINGAFSLVSFAIPDAFLNAVNYIFGYTGYVTGFVNVSGIFEAIAWFLTFTTYWYSLKLVLWVINALPFLNTKINLKL